MNLTVRDAASLLQVSQKTVYRWIQKGILPAYRVQDQYRFQRGELLQWVASQRVNASAELFCEPETERQPLPELSWALERGGIYYRIGGQDKESVLKAVVGMLRLPEGVDKDVLCRAMLAREELASTGIGNGIALPHVRYPIIEYIEEPFVALCFLENRIDFGAMDGEPVSVLFPVASPTIRGHLHLISKISFVLRDPAFLKLLREQASRERILASLRLVEERMNSRSVLQSEVRA